MIEKEVREYKQGTKRVKKINILQSDNLEKDEKVVILTVKEFNELNDTINKYKTETDKLDKRLIKLEKEQEVNQSKIKNQRHYDKLLTRIENNHEKNLTNVTKDLDKQHNNQIIQLNKEYNIILDKKTREYNTNYELFNKELIKYRTVYELQNKALKEIAELSYIDLFRNKFKKIAKENIKQLSKPVEIEVLPPEKDALDEIKELISKFQR